MTGKFQEGDEFEINDLSSIYHGWNGRVVDVLEDGYKVMLEHFDGEDVSLHFEYVEEESMASKVYI